jgi:hypothetical protein
MSSQRHDATMVLLLIANVRPRCFSCAAGSCAVLAMASCCWLTVGPSLLAGCRRRGPEPATWTVPCAGARLWRGAKGSCFSSTLAVHPEGTRLPCLVRPTTPHCGSCHPLSGWLAVCRLTLPHCRPLACDSGAWCPTATRGSLRYGGRVLHGRRRLRLSLSAPPSSYSLSASGPEASR